ncbi:MAG: VWA domain-containing protein [Bacteroidota bacterium]|jgi:Ca-activated chloride channel family protein|nr:VWA domain-containing protein [Bacteroidota bacterium]
MEYIKEFGFIEILLILTFIIFYLIYIVRLLRINSSISVSFKGVITKIIFRSTYFFLMIIALLGPSFGNSKKEIKVIGKDIMIAIDLSESMNANDIQPSRLEKIKFELKKIIDEFNSDRIGIIMFSNEAYIQCPLTYDKNALNLFIETLNTGLVPNSGTDFGPPLDLSLDKLLADKIQKNDKSKIIILISDGEDFGENTYEIVDKIKESSIKLFTVGIGTAQGTRITLRNGLFKKDKDGKEVITKLNSTSLKKIANETKGKYFEISNQINQINGMIYEIKEIKGDLIDSKFMDVTKNKYFYFLFVALILMSMDFLFNFKIIKI